MHVLRTMHHKRKTFEPFFAAVHISLRLRQTADVRSDLLGCGGFGFLSSLGQNTGKQKIWH